MSFLTLQRVAGAGVGAPAEQRNYATSHTQGDRTARAPYTYLTFEPHASLVCQEKIIWSTV